ncbi:MAG: 7-carboxy-7-deazaguanine synthase QueE, partial [Thermoguttaceae bacterium]
MWILEIYQSKQGEGIWAGTPSVFVRVLGCELRCRFCDTVYARSNFSETHGEVGADLSADEIVGRVLLLDHSHVVITGGEPMIQPEIEELTRLLHEYDCTVTVETSGIVDVAITCDLVSISPKLSNSTPLFSNVTESGAPICPDEKDVQEELIRQHEANRFRPEVVQNLISRYNYQLKFVIDTPEDFIEIENYVALLQNVLPYRVLLMPQATDVETMDAKAKWMMPY